MGVVVSCFHAMVEQHADATAVIYGNTSLSYAELDRRSNRLARLLLERGVGAESLVGVCVERSAQMIVALLGILKVGAAYVPIDADYPSDRLEYILLDSAILTIVGTESALMKLPAFCNPLLESIYLEADGAESESYSDRSLPVEIRNSQLAYVIYTSGSTGKPKGVCVAHDSIVNLVRNTNYVDFDSRLCIAQASNACFDAATFEIWGALLNGGKLSIVDKATLLEPILFARQVLRDGIDTLFLTTALFNLYAFYGGGGFSNLKHVLFGGEQVNPSAVARFLSSEFSGRLLHVYGPTEATTFSSWHLVAEMKSEYDDVPIGHALTGASLHVVDEWLNLLPDGMVGELYVGGRGLARGYLYSPELTAARFIADPFAEVSGQRMYRTGDLVRRLPDGSILFVGRDDHQVKIRGYRIESAEIEAALLALDGVREAVVLAAGDEVHKFLVAYVGTTDDRVTPETLRNRLKDKLPDYMIPARYVLLASLPLTPNSKIDRERLVVLGQQAVAATASFIAPRSGPEHILAECWKEALGIEVVGVHDNFFEIGGDSLTALRVKAHANSLMLGFELVDAFEYQTIAELALHTFEIRDQEIPNDGGFALVKEEDRALLPADIEAAYPLTQMQLGMLFHSNFDNDSAMYHVVVGAGVKLPFSEKELAESVDEIGSRHEIFRTSLQLDNFSEPLQLVHKEAKTPLTIVDWRGISPPEQLARYKDWVSEESRNRFGYQRPPLLRVFIHRTSDAQFQFTFSFHHAIMDGWSDASLAVELFQRYAARLQGNSSPLGPLKVRYRDYVALELAALKSEASKNYWAEVLNDVEPLVLSHRDPAVIHADAVQLPAKQVGGIAISPETAHGLSSLAHRAKVPLKSVLLAVHLKALSVLSGQADVLTGIVSNGRLEVADGDKAIGLFLNTLPFRTRIRHETWTDFVRGVFDAEKVGLVHRRYPLSAIMRDNGGRGAPEVVFNYTDFHILNDVSALWDPLSTGEGAGGASVPIQVNFWRTPEGIDGTVNNAATAEGAKYATCDLLWYAHIYSKVMLEVATNEASFVDDMATLDSDESALTTISWNATHRELADSTFSELFEQHVRRTPDAIALVCDDLEMTYGTLNARANRLAHYLIDAGVGPEDVVAVALPRGIELFVSLLAILKAGAAYLPIDTGYPDERIALMLNDLLPVFAVTSASIRDRLSTVAARLYLDSSATAAAIASCSTENPSDSVRRRKLSPANIAYVIYTSGSTGKPKGVAVSHLGIPSLVSSHIEKLDITSQSRVLQFASISFDAAFWEMCMSLLSGATLVVPLSGSLLASDNLAALMQRARITHALLPPAVLSTLAENALPEGLVLIVGGEACPSSLVERWAHRCKMINAYGPTESTVCTTMSHLHIKSAGSPPIGTPNSNAQVYVLDMFLHAVPVGVPGELYIQSPGLARGYFNRPEMTAERFVANPFGPPGSRMYRTGDRVRWSKDGQLEFIGRTDRQIKIRGFRVEPQEIEASLLRTAGVSQAIVDYRTDRSGRKQLIGYVVVADSSLKAPEIRRALEQELPGYMLPSAIIVLDAIPLSVTGKIEWNRLPLPDIDRSVAPYVAPRTELEEAMAVVWSEILGIDAPGIHDDFFASGGDSLSALTFAAKLQRRLSIKVPISLVVAHRTIAAIGTSLALTSAAESMRDGVVLLKKGPGAQALFLVPPGSGDCASYAHLVAALDSRFSIFGFERTELSQGNVPGLMPLEEIASHYIRKLRAAQSAGPYFLAGWSIGGVIAYEMAVQLKMAGEEVGLVGVIDSRLPKVSDANSQFAGAAARLLRNSILSEDELIELERTFDLDQVIRLSPGAHAHSNDADTVSHLKIYRRMHLVHAIALHAYHQTSAVDNLCYIAARQECELEPAEQRAEEFVQLSQGSSSTHLVDADHYSVLESSAVDAVAAIIAKAMPREYTTESQQGTFA